MIFKQNTYIPGKKIFVADYLSRDYMNNCILDYESINDYFHVINTKHVEFSNEKLEQFKK